MSKVWIDLTDISVWDGHHTGTQRVVYQIAKRYHGQPNVGYFIFNPRQATFHEYSFDDVRERVEAKEQITSDNEITVPLKSRIRQRLGEMYDNSPEYIQRSLNAERRAKLKKVYKKARTLIKGNQPAYIVPDTPAINFGKNDTLLIMGKPWDYPNLIETLRKEILEHHFKIIQVVYDLIPIFLPHLFGEPLFKPYTQHMFETAAISDGLLAISESSKRDMQRFCEEMLLPCPPIEVIRLGDDFSTAAPKKPGINVSKKDFILCVGTVEIRKNHQLLYNAYKLGLSKGVKLPKLVISGGRGWYTQDILYAFGHDPAMRDLVFPVHHINDNELRWLYENCLFSIYPSVYEGWGLPIAESLSYSKMCISSHTSSMTEIAGDLIEYFNPYDPGECLKLIQKYCDDKLLDVKERAIKKIYKPYDWDDTYRQVNIILSKITKNEERINNK